MKIDVGSRSGSKKTKRSRSTTARRTSSRYSQRKPTMRRRSTEHAERLGALQEKLFAVSTHALLIVLQGMDSAGKDGAIKHVMTGVNPQGCKIASFKTPTPVEARHDFLWRAVLELPERGMIGVFNRSYYEAVLIERVHPELLATESVYVAPDETR